MSNDMLKIELDKFEKYESWLDYQYWLNKMIKLFKKFPSKQMKHKEELYRKLALCFNCDALVVKDTALSVYAEIVAVFAEKDDHISQENMEHFKSHVPLISIGLFEIFKSAGGPMKYRAFTLIKSIFTVGIKHFPQCLPSLLSLMSPCLNSSHEELNEETWEFMTWLRNEFQEFFFGSLWMSLKRNNMGRIGLINFLRNTIRSSSNWLQTREVDIKAIREIESQESEHADRYGQELPKESRGVEDEETEGSILFEDSDNEEETTIESKLRIYLESFLKDASTEDESDGPNSSPEQLDEVVELQEMGKEARSESDKDEQVMFDKEDTNEENLRAEEAIHMEVNGDEETLPFLQNEEENPDEKTGEEIVEDEGRLGEEYYLQIKEKLMSNFTEQLTTKSTKEFSIKTIIPDSRMATTAIVESLQDPNKFVKKSILDLFFNELSPEYGLFSVRSVVQITHKSLLLLENHDYSIQRKLFKYFTSSEVQRMLKSFNQVEFLENKLRFKDLIRTTTDESKQRALIKLYFLAEGVRLVFKFDEMDPLVMRVLHVTRAIIAENRKLVPLVFEFVLPDMLKFLLDLQKWFFLNSNASAKKSKRFLIKFLRVLQPALPNLLFSLSQKATFTNLPPLSLIYKMTELQETSLQALVSKTDKQSCYQRLLSSKFYSLPDTSPEDTNASFFQVIFVQLFLKGLHDHEILRALHPAEGQLQASASEQGCLPTVVNLLKNEDSLRELFLCMELLDNSLGGFNARSSLTVINLETLVFATQAIRLLKSLLKDGVVYSKISFDAEDFVAKTVKCLALLELFVYSGTRVVMLSGVDLRTILHNDPGYKELMGYVDGHKTALVNPFSQSLLDFRKTVPADSTENSQMYLSKLDVTGLLGSLIKPEKSPLKEPHQESPLPYLNQKGFDLEEEGSKSRSRSQRENRKLLKSKQSESGEPSINDEDLEYRLRNIDSNLVLDEEEEVEFDGLFDSKDISKEGGTFKEGMFDFINFFIRKHQKESKESASSEELIEGSLLKSKEFSATPNFQSNTKVSLMRESEAQSGSAFLKSNKKCTDQIVTISQSKKGDSHLLSLIIADTTSLLLSLCHQKRLSVPLLFDLFTHPNPAISRWLSIFDTFLFSEFRSPSLLLVCVQSLAPYLFKLDSLYNVSVKKTVDTLLDLQTSTHQSNALLMYFTKGLIENAWGLLDEHQFRTAALELVLDINEGFHVEVISALKSCLRKDSDLSVKNATLQRCAIFHATCSVQQSFVTRKKTKKLLNFCVFSLLEFLDHDDHKLRLTAKSWLVDSAGRFHDILDLFLARLVKDSNVLRCPGNEYYYTKAFNFQSIFHLFKVMKSTISTIPEIFARFIYTNNLSPFLNRELLKKFNPSSDQLFGGVHFLGKNKHFNYFRSYQGNTLKPELKYLDVLLYLVARYLVSGAIPELNKEFVRQNYIINNLASELLEVLIKGLENMHFRVVDRTLLELVLFEFRRVSEQKCIVRQMELLSLLKALLFNSSLFSSKSQRRRKYFQRIFEHFRLQDQVLVCLRDQRTNYAVFQILGFVENCIDLIGSFEMTQEILKDSVQRIFKNYFEMIMSTQEGEAKHELVVDEVSRKIEFKQDSSSVVLEAVIRLLDKFLVLNLHKKRDKTANALKYDQLKMELNNQNLKDRAKDSEEGIVDLLQEKFEFGDKGKKVEIDWDQFGQYDIGQSNNLTSRQIARAISDDMYFILKIMVYKWNEAIPSDSLWISKLGISNQKLNNLKVVLATHDTSLFNNQTAKQNRLFIKFLRESIKQSTGTLQKVEGESKEFMRSQVKQTTEFPEDADKSPDDKNTKLNKVSKPTLEEPSVTVAPENEVIADVYLRIFTKFQVNSMDSLLELWKEQISAVKKINAFEDPQRHHLLEFLSHSPTLSKISQMTIVLNLTLSQFFSAIVNSKNFVHIQEHYDPDYSKPKGWFGSIIKTKVKKSVNTATNFDVNFEEACILSYVYSVLKNISLNKKLTQEIIITKRTLRKSWFHLIAFLKRFRASNNPICLIWILEIYHLFALKFNVQILITERSIKKTLHLHLNEVLNSLVEVIKSPQLYLPEKPEDKNKKHILSLLFPLPPSVLSNFWDQVFTGFYDLSVFGCKRDLRDSFRVCSLDCLTEIVIPLFRATYSTSNQSRIGERLGVVLIQLVDILQNNTPDTSTPIVQSDLGQVIVRQMTDMEQHPRRSAQQGAQAFNFNFESLINQKISQLVLNCIKNLGMNVYVPIKMPIRGFFNSDQFFATDPVSLRIWGNVQTLSLSLMKTSLLDGFIAKLNFSSMFMKKQDQEIVQIRALQRISFIIFAHECDSEVVVTQIRKVLGKIINVLVGPSPSSQLLVYIFFALRIILTRLHEEKVGLILQNIWPIVMITIIKIFDSSYQFNHDSNVQLAVLKFLQLLQIKRYNNLFNHQWIIAPDFYRVHLSSVRGLSKFDNFRSVSGFSFDSLISSALPRNHVLQYIISQEIDPKDLEAGIEFVTTRNPGDFEFGQSQNQSFADDDSDLSNLSEMTDHDSDNQSKEIEEEVVSPDRKKQSVHSEDLEIPLNSFDNSIQIIHENYVRSRQDFVKVSEKFLNTCLAINRDVFRLSQEGLEKLVFTDFIDLERNLEKFEVKKT